MGSRGRRKRKVQDRQVKGLVRKNKKSPHIPFPNKVSKVASNVKVTLELFRDQRDGEFFIHKGTGGKSKKTEEKVGTRTVIRYRPQRLTKLFVETALRPKH